MLLLMWVNALWCEVYYLLDSQEAGEAYTDCVSAATGADDRSECFFGFLEAVGNATIDFFGCMYL